VASIDWRLERERPWRGEPQRFAAHSDLPSQTVERTTNAKATAVQHVQICHRRADVGVPKQLLYGSNVMTSSSRCVANECRRLVQMKARGTPLRIATDPRGGKHKLPAPLCGGVGILAIQGKRQNDPSHTGGKIPFVLSSDLPQVSLEPLFDGIRQHRPPVFLAVSPSNDNFMPVKVEVLYSKLQTLLQPQPGTIERATTIHIVPWIFVKIVLTASRLSTTGTRCVSLALGICSMSPTSMRRT